MAAVLENRLVVVLLAATLGVASAWLSGAALEYQGQGSNDAGGSGGSTPTGTASTCHLANGIEHVIYLEFDNLRLSRDQPSIPSDLEQMPHLLDFLQANGTLLTSSHSPLVSGSGGAQVTSLTGLYPDHHGQAIGEGWRYFNPDGTTSAGSASGYWSSRVSDGHAAAPAGSDYNLVTTGGRNVPAPWPVFTRAGCDVGAVGGPANMVLRNTTTDIVTAFGAGSREAAEARADGARAAADFTGLAIHCASQTTNCTGEHGGRPDRLPDEPGEYSGFNALFGQRYVAPRIGVSGHLTDLGGSPINGFPGFSAMTPGVSLAYVAAMQEHAVPITYAYIADAHDPRGDGGYPGPGEPAYVRQLHDYDQEFETFMGRLGRDGLTSANTLFVVTADGGGRFVGTAPSPAGCDGLHTPCHYAQLGAVQVDLAGMLRGLNGSSTFAMREGSVPAVWIDGDPAPMAAPTRGLERAVAQLKVRDPYTGTRQPIVRYLADRQEMRLLHMVSADPARTPSFVLLAQPSYFVSGSAAVCPDASCATVDTRHTYSMGNSDPTVSTTWLALAGPGVARRVDPTTWAEQADIRPTMLALVGLQDGYVHDGRVLSAALQAETQPPGVRDSQAAYESVAAQLKQLDAPVGRVGMLSLAAATRAAASSSASDADYRSYVARMDGFIGRRDSLADTMRADLEGAAFGGRALDEKTALALTEAADRLMGEMARA